MALFEFRLNEDAPPRRKSKPISSVRQQTAIECKNEPKLLSTGMRELTEMGFDVRLTVWKHSQSIEIRTYNGWPLQHS